MSQSNDGILRPRRHKLGDRTAHQQTALPPQTVPRQLTQAEWAARRTARTPAMVEALQQIDVAPTEQARREIIEWLVGVYEARGGGALVGLFGHCYLGAPFVDHAFDLTGTIREHYTAADSVPPMYTGARPFAMSDAYAYIEIYADGQIIPVRPDGSPAI